MLLFSSDFSNAQFHVEGKRLEVRRTKKMSLTFMEMEMIPPPPDVYSKPCQTSKMDIFAE